MLLNGIEKMIWDWSLIYGMRSLSLTSKWPKRVCIEECGIDLKIIRAFGEGWDNTAYLVNDALVFRFPRREIAVSCMLAEIDILPLVKTSIKIPERKYFTVKSQITDKPFIGYQKIDGLPTGMLDLNEAEISNLVRPIAKFLKELHTTSAPGNIAQKWEKSEVDFVDAHELYGRNQPEISPEG